VYITRIFDTTRGAQPRDLAPILRRTFDPWRSSTTRRSCAMKRHFLAWPSWRAGRLRKAVKYFGLLDAEEIGDFRAALARRPVARSAPMFVSASDFVTPVVR
jgi:hypothetical protein